MLEIELTLWGMMVVGLFCNLDTTANKTIKTVGKVFMVVGILGAIALYIAYCI